jgi:predicted Zn finger-like uncharacterized protein
MSPLIIDCPACARKLRVPDELFGKAVKCPTCDHTFRATDHQSLAAASPDPALEAATAREEPVVPCCPSCGEHIDKGSARCRFCGEQLTDDEAGDDRLKEESRQERHDAEPHRGGLILALGIISIALAACGILILPLALAACVMGRRDLVKMRRHLMDRDGEGLTHAGWICSIIGTILASLSSLACLLYVSLFLAMALGARHMPIPAPVPVPGPAQPVPIPPRGPRDDKAAGHFVNQTVPRHPGCPDPSVLVDPRLSTADQPTPMLRPLFLPCPPVERPELRRASV